jgi:predicted secreted protein
LINPCLSEFGSGFDSGFTVRRMITSHGRRIAGALVTLIITTTSLATATTAAATTARASHLPTYTLSDSGRHVTVKKSNEIKLDLRTDQDGGYRWAIGSQGATRRLSVVSRTTRPYQHKKGTVGYPYHTIYILKAINYGSKTIRFIERRPSHKSDIARRFNLHINVPAPPKPKPVQHACTTTSSGSCIQGGEFCPQADYGQSGWDANGTRYVCEGDTTHPHWELP